MAGVMSPYDFLGDVRNRAEALRMEQVRSSIRGEIRAGSVTTDKLAAGAVTADKIAADTITAGQIAAGAITASEIAAGQVTADKLSVSTLSAITANMGTLTAGTITGGTVQSGGGVPRAVVNPDGFSVFNNAGDEFAAGGPGHVKFYNGAGALQGGLHCYITNGPGMVVEAVNDGATNTGESIIRVYTPGGGVEAQVTAGAAFGVEAAAGSADATVLDSAGDGHWPDGDLHAHAFTVISDRRLKKGVKPIGGGVAAVAGLRPVSYTVKSNGREQAGFVAQEVAEVWPGAVREITVRHGEETVLAYSLTEVVARTVAAVQELGQRLERVEADK